MVADVLSKPLQAVKMKLFQKAAVVCRRGGVWQKTTSTEQVILDQLQDITMYIEYTSFFHSLSEPQRRTTLFHYDLRS